MIFSWQGWAEVLRNILLSCLTQARGGCHYLINDFLIFLLSLLKRETPGRYSSKNHYLQFRESRTFNLILSSVEPIFQFKWTNAHFPASG